MNQNIFLNCKIISFLFCCLALLSVQIAPALSADLETKASFAYLEDVGTGSVLLEKEADALMAPASMAKLVTAAVVFDEIKAGRLTLDDIFLVSEEAHLRGGPSSGGSTMFLRPGSNVRVEDLLKGAIVQSGNDACLVLAEGIAGTEASFVRLMNNFAQKIGMTNSNFETATGLPHPDQKVTARDLATVTKYIINEHSEFLPYYSLESFEWEGVNQLNRNPLLDENIGADGMKTGFTEESGYGIVASTLKDGNRRVLVLNGLQSKRARGQEAFKILSWADRAFEQRPILTSSQSLGSLRVYGGQTFSVEVGAQTALKALILKGKAFESIYRAEVKYNGPIKAPVLAGTVVGTVSLKNSDGNIVSSANAIALEDVPQGPVYRRALDAAMSLMGLI